MELALVGRIPPPVAVDETGVVVREALALVQSESVLEVSCASLVDPAVLLDLTLRGMLQYATSWCSLVCLLRLCTLPKLSL